MNASSFVKALWDSLRIQLSSTASVISVILARGCLFELQIQEEGARDLVVTFLMVFDSRLQHLVCAHSDRNNPIAKNTYW